MHKTAKIGLLAYPGSPLTYPTVESLQALGYKNIHIICDGDQRNEKFIQIISERTNGKAIFHQLTDFQKLGTPFYFVSNHNAPECIELVCNLQLDILGSCGTPRKLNLPLLQSTHFGVINCHPGKLPQYRGSSSVEWALFNDDEIAATAHFMTEGYDEGPIIQIFPLQTKGLDYSTIRLSMIQHQAASLAAAIHSVLDKGIPATSYPPQPEGKSWPRIPDDKMRSLLSRRF